MSQHPAPYTNEYQWTLDETTRLYDGGQNGAFRTTACDAPLREVPPTTDLGVLEVLPTEILQQVMSNFSMKDLMHFRHANHKALNAVWALPHFEAVVTEDPMIVSALVRTKTGQNITYHQMCEQFFSFNCDYCGETGGYLFLVTGKRTCLSCIRTERDFFLIDGPTAKREFGISDHDIRSLRTMQTVRGIYSVSRKSLPSKKKLVQEAAARQKGIDKHGGYLEMNLAASRLWNRQSAKAVARRQANPRAKGPVPRGHIADGGSRNPHRYVGVIRMPYMDRVTHELEYGVYCTNCQKYPGYTYTMYSQEAYEAHKALQVCWTDN